MRQINLLFIALLCISSVYSQCNIANAPAITLDQGTAVVCMHVNLNGTYSGQSYAFRLNVDYFEALVLNGFATYIRDQVTKSNATSVSVELQFQNTQTSQSKTIEIYNRTDLRYRDILSFVLIINEGGFTELKTDNEKCDNLIGDSFCYDGQAYSRAGSDGAYPGNDPRFFVSWMGSDIDKNHFISHTRRLSRFSSFSVGSIYQDAKNIINA